jgi:flagellar biosynthesis GTPase FlhF
VSKQLGSLFLTAAFGPLQASGMSIMARRVEEGLIQVSGVEIMAALQRGIEAVAKATGLPTSHVAHYLPMAELRDLAASVGQHQVNSLQQWRLHAGWEGLLDGIADLTVDGRTPSASMCLLRLSKKMQLDKALSIPLRQLSDDLDRWEQLLRACRKQIDDGTALKRAYHRKRFVVIGVIVAIVLGFSAVMVWMLRVRNARARVDEQLAAPDPCARVVDDQDDLDKASDVQRDALKEAAQACETKKEAERKAEEERQRKAEEERKRKAEAARQKKRCEDLAADIAAGRAIEDDEIQGETKALLQRMTDQALKPNDLQLKANTFPCPGTAAEKAIGQAYARAALASLAGWINSRELTDPSITLLAAGKDGLTGEQRVSLSNHVETYAKKSLLGGNEQRIDRTLKLCTMIEKMGQPERQYCQAVRSLRARQQGGQ